MKIIYADVSTAKVGDIIEHRDARYRVVETGGTLVSAIELDDSDRPTVHRVVFSSSIKDAMVKEAQRGQ